MKTIALINWLLLVIYGLFLSYAALTIDQSGGDAAGRGIARAYLLFGFILLALLIGVNCLPFLLSRQVVLVSLAFLICACISQLLNQLTTQQARKQDAERRNGRYYFHDSARRELAQAIVDRDFKRFQAGLQKPIPQLNESGEEHLTLLDFATIEGAFSSPQDWVIPFLTELLAKGATFNNANSHHLPMYSEVSGSFSPTLLEWFLKNGADPNEKVHQNKSKPLLLTVLEDETERLTKLKLLLDYGANPNSVYPATLSDSLAGNSALLTATRLEAWDVCQLLLTKGADPNLEGPHHVRVIDLVRRRAELYTQQGTPPATFTTFAEILQSKTDKPDKNNPK
ncbi:hypothetical protein GO755_33860 [Spirosoma sp. HMF4905]|uniref:Ankyrin repeat domain-containing protein n=1 Tax=Spirosoma arboris TaxID=2682092 RepID=A0A7K1SMP3_9BACT|nr:ankyrin repeat domain-containing protein [Spirosoma arboris]MVM35061.1 hypothetical protein [Spirosoma arboris]